MVKHSNRKETSAVEKEKRKPRLLMAPLLIWRTIITAVIGFFRKIGHSVFRRHVGSRTRKAGEEAIAMVKKKDREATSVIKKEEQPKPRLAMVPIFSWQTVMAVIVGLIVGVGLGLGYWIMSPTLGTSASSSTGTGSGQVEPGGLFGLLGMEHTGLYESKVRVQVVSPGSEYVSLGSLQQKGEYCAAKANSLPFFNYLSQYLAEQAPKLSYTVEQLDRIITTEYDWNSELPAIKITVVGATEQASIFLAELVPQAFKSYLITEQSEKRQKDYQNVVKEIESVKAGLYEAEQELDALIPHDVLNDPNYIALNARLEVLQRELDDKAVELTTLVTLGKDIQLEYTKTLQQVSNVSTDLIEAEQELRGLEDQGVNSNVSNDASYIILNAKIRALGSQLDRLMAGWTETTSSGVVLRKAGLAEMIANGNTTGTDYTDRLEKVETTSAALAEAKRELAILERGSDKNLESNLDYRLAQIKVDILSAELSILHERLALLARESTTGDSQSDAQSDFERTAAALSDAKNELVVLKSQLGYDRLSADLDYKIAQDKVDNLNERMNGLTQELSSLVGENVETSEITSYLVAGKPSVPYPVLPERPKASNTLMMGALAGVVVAWVLLNFRWIAKGMPSSSTTKPDENEEDE